MNANGSPHPIDKFDIEHDALKLPIISSPIEKLIPVRSNGLIDLHL